MTWNEAVAAMRSGRIVARPGNTPIRLRVAQTIDGQQVQVVVTAAQWCSGEPIIIGDKSMAATDWKVWTGKVG